ncbi:MAG: hypothetical protein BWY44_00220 [Candidatus Omnitrophica bacterium ADurb.Bin292]|jgi:uncharacterized protein (TIGR00255 family)|nr:MAG: hypothetical protein BWY44_00220 [Candidatus Omnitrophica bacterium ADurb.Bin292]
MIKSMTAFSRVVLTAGGKQWAVEIKSLNQRYFELGLRLPPALLPYETQVRRLVQGMIRRGKVSLAVSEEGNGEQRLSYELDRAQVKAYLDSAATLKKKFRFEGRLLLADVLRLPGVVREKVNTRAKTLSWPEFQRILVKGIERTISLKREEGRKLAKDIRERLEKISRTTDSIEKLVKQKQSECFVKVSRRIREILGDEKMDQDRMAREVAFLADKSDITEELVRMRSHLKLFTKWLSQAGEFGREMDFLCQEMMREANTMASKAQMFEVSKEAIAVKSEIEKIREQVQNVE